MQHGSTCAPLDVLIVGSGISGLTAASSLVARFPRLRILEARSRVGGRLLSHDGVDLGGSWWWSHDASAVQIARRLGIGTVPQRLDGNAWVHQQGRAAQRAGNVGDQIAPCGPGAQRFAGGYAELPNRLAQSLPAGTLQLGSRVVSLEYQSSLSSIRVSMEGGEALYARRVILAVPPRLASRIQFTPALPEVRRRQLASTATWCGDWAKVVAIFKTPFWRGAGDSGAAATPGGLVEMWWEASSGVNGDGRAPALAGLAFGSVGAAKLNAFGPAIEKDQLALARSAVEDKDGPPASTSSLASSESPANPNPNPNPNPNSSLASSESPAGLRAEVVRALGALYGEEVVQDNLLRVTHKVWMADADTYAPPPDERETPDPRGSYGHPHLRTPLPWGVFFAGTESESESGHVAGALRAAERVAREVIASGLDASPSEQ